MANTFDRDAVDNSNIRTLRTEAASAGDSDMVADCDSALNGDNESADRCIDAIEEAWNRAL